MKQYLYETYLSLLSLTYNYFYIWFNFVFIFNTGCDPLNWFFHFQRIQRDCFCSFAWTTLSPTSDVVVTASFSFMRVLGPSCLNRFVHFGPSTMNTHMSLYSSVTYLLVPNPYSMSQLKCHSHQASTGSQVKLSQHLCSSFLRCNKNLRKWLSEQFQHLSLPLCSPTPSSWKVGIASILFIQ